MFGLRKRWEFVPWTRTFLSQMESLLPAAAGERHCLYVRDGELLLELNCPAYTVRVPFVEIENIDPYRAATFIYNRTIHAVQEEVECRS